MNSENSPKTEFHALFNRFLEEGKGRTAATPWTKASFAHEIGTALYGKGREGKFQTSTLNSWLAGDRLPRTDQFKAVCEVFFRPDRVTGKLAADAVEAEDKLRSAWDVAWEDSRNQRPAARTSGPPPDPELPDPGSVPYRPPPAAGGNLPTWEKTSGHELEGLVDFRSYPPEPVDFDGNIAVPADLEFGIADVDYDNGSVRLSATAAAFKVSGDGYVAVKGKTVGDAKRRHKNFVYKVGGNLIRGPKSKNGPLFGDVLDGETVITSVKEARPGGELILQITARLNDLNIEGTWLRNLDDEGRRNEKIAVAKLRIKKAGGPDHPGSGDFILAEHRWRRNV